MLGLVAVAVFLVMHVSSATPATAWRGGPVATAVPEVLAHARRRRVLVGGQLAPLRRVVVGRPGSRDPGILTPPQGQPAGSS
jgi:hypothetical protein